MFRSAEQWRVGHYIGNRAKKALELLDCSQDLLFDLLDLEMPCAA